MTFTRSHVVLGVVALAMTLTCAPANAQTVPVNKCAAAKTKCVIGKVKGLLGCHQKAEGKSLPVDPACISKVVGKFSACIVKPEAKPPCLTTGDGAALEAAIDAYVLDVVQELDPGYPVPVTNKCSVGKKKNVAAKTAGKLGCLAKAFGKAPGTVDPACLSKADGKFFSAWGKLEAKPPCLTTGDAAAIEAKVDAFFVGQVAALSNLPTCGNGFNDAGEACDASASPAGWAQCGATFTCVACNCACPTKVTFSGNASDPATILDTGWTGISHRSPAISNGDVTATLSCSATERPCGTCTVSGPIANPNAGAGQLDNQRCTNDTSIRCTTNAPCTGGGGTCQFFFGSALPLAAGGVTTCVFNQFNGTVSGTANVESGEAVTSALLTSRVYAGIAIDNPCPRCVGDGAINDGVQGGTCSGGTRNGLACDANGSVPGRPDYGSTSLDCPSIPGALIAALPIDLSNATDPVTKTVSATNPVCTGEAGERCLCDTCNNINQEPCDANADCPDPAGPIGPICGGRRCLGGLNAGAACTVTSECPGGGICGRPGEPTKPSGCLDDTSTVGVLDCSDTGPVDGEGECLMGPVDTTCSVASGHAQRGCLTAGDCGGGIGSCEANNRRCFLTGGFSGKNGTNTLIAVGMEDTPMGDTSNPTLGSVFCVGPTGSASVNAVAGLPGPGRVTIKGTAVGRP